MIMKRKDIISAIEGTKMFVGIQGDELAAKLSEIYNTQISAKDCPYCYIIDSKVEWGNSPKKFRDSELDEIDVTTLLRTKVEDDNAQVRRIGSIYYFLVPDFANKTYVIYKDVDTASKFDQNCWNHKNYFNTNSEAEAAIEKYKIAE